MAGAGSNAAAQPLAGGGAFEILIALAAVVAAILAIAWVMRRLNPGGFAGSSHLRVVGSLPVGPRERLLLVDVAGTQLLIGVAAGQINTLHTLAEPVPQPERASARDFAARMRQAIGTERTP